MALEPLPPSVRLIRRLRRALRRHRGRVGAVVAGLALAAVLALGLYTVDSSESAAVVRFGRVVDDAVGPGLHLRLPLGIDRVAKARTGDVLRLELQGETWTSLDFLTGDENLVETSLVVQYRISRLGDYLYRTESAETLIVQAVRAALVEAVAGMPVEDLLTVGKAQIQNQVRRETQARLDASSAGVTLVGVNLTAVNPPGEVSSAFRDVSDARAEAAQATHRAEAEKERALRMAGGEAGSLVSAAEAAASGRRDQARGSAERFGKLATEAKRARGQVMTELRAATLQKVLPRVRLIVLAPGEKPRIDVHIVETRQPVAPPQTTPGRSAVTPPPSSGEDDH